MIAYVQAIPERIPYVDAIIGPRLTNGGLITDVTPVVDEDRNGPLWNAMRIWREIAKQDDPALIVQDDAFPHRQFSECVRDILAHVQRGAMDAVSLYASPRKRHDQIAAQGCNFVEAYDFIGLPGMILTPEFAAGLIDYAASAAERKHDDVVASDYARESGNAVWITIPSVVQHDVNVRSSMRHPKSTNGVTRRSRLWSAEIPHGWFSEIRSRRYGKAAG